MVGQNKKDGVFVHVFHGFANKTIHPLIKILYRFQILTIQLRSASAFEEAVEHVLHPIARIKDTGYDSAACLFECGFKHPLSLMHGVVGLLEECFLIDNSFIQCPGVLGHAERRISAEQLGQINGIEGRMADR